MAKRKVIENTAQIPTGAASRQLAKNASQKSLLNLSHSFSLKDRAFFLK